MKRVLPVLSLVLLAVLPFWGGVDGDYIEDDINAIRERAELRADGDLWSVWNDNYWPHVWGGLYRPLTVFTYGVDRAIHGARDAEAEGDGLGPPEPFGIHFGNLLINAGCALLVFALLRRLYGDRPYGTLAPWIGAAVFAVHPAHTEAVVHMVGRADLLATFFFLAAWVAHGSPDRARGLRPWFGGALYLLSLLSKESGAALPAVLLFEAGLRLPWRGIGALVRGQLLPMLPYVVALLAFVGLRGVVLGGQMDPPQGFLLYSAGVSVGFPDPAAFEVPLTMTHAFGEYLLLLVAPLWLSADYTGFPHATTPTLAVILSAIVLGTLIAMAARAGRRGNREPLAWLSVFVWTFLPVSNLVFITGIVMAERALYLPSIAFVGLVTWALPSLLARGKGMLVVVGVVLALFTVRTAVRAPVWEDADTLHHATVENGRYAGHLAYTGAVDVRLRRMQADPSTKGELLADTLEMARRSVELERTVLNVTHLALLTQMDGALGESLGLWMQVEAAEPSHRADIERCLEAIRARAEDRMLISDAVRLVGEAFDQSQAAADLQRAAFWRTELEALLVAWIESSVERRDWLFAIGGRGMLMRLQPRHPVLTQHQVAILEGAIRAHLGAGRQADARALATELRQVDAGNSLATQVLGG